MVTVNGSPAHAQVWTEGEATESAWRFIWMPPGEGKYLFQPLISDWQSNLIYKSYMPLIPAHHPVKDNQGRQVDNKLSLGSGPLRDLLASGNWPQAAEEINNVYAGKPATLYVDLQPPQISIAPTTLTSAQRIGTEYINLTGSASDSVLLHRVDISIDGGQW